MIAENILFARQEDKEPAFASVKTVIGMLEVSAEFARNISFNRERILKALPAGHLDATTLADYLVKKVSNILGLKLQNSMLFLTFLVTTAWDWTSTSIHWF